ncbi:MAG: DUF5312 domain-containing protein [Treponema sp.]|nr:DUF5312 domain-containing protein [Treponema sp.]
MSFLQTITNLFESIFKRNSPDAQKKQVVKKMEATLKMYTPVLYKNGNLLPNFGEAVFQLYKNVRPLDDLFMVTVSSNNIPRKKRFEAQLLMTGYSPSDQELVESLSYENRKAQVMEEGGGSRVYESQRKVLEQVIRALNSEAFKNMDREILELRQFVDFCHFNFLPILQVFDNNFEAANPSYKPNYREVPVEKMVNALEDLYFQMSSFHLTNAHANAVVALAQILSNGNLSDQKAEGYISNIRKISYVLKRILTPEHLKAIIQIAKRDLQYDPRSATISGSPRSEFATLLQEHFKADEQRIKTEFQDARIEEELANLFGGNPLSEVLHYDSQANAIVQANTSLSFMWILPMKILKNFFQMYITDNIKTLLNDLVIEGFFSNQNYKSNFSSTVFSALSGMETIEEFEQSFTSGQKNSIAVLESYVKDSAKDQTFYKKLVSMVNEINAEAKKIIQDETSNLYSLYKCLGDILQDAKKPSSEIIENLKVLLMSSRNKDNTAFLERTFPTWKIFFDIMKNYAIISTGEINN